MKIKEGIILCVVFVLSLFSLRLEAQITMKITIKAIVYGSGREPVVGAVISCDKDDVQAVSDSSGEFSLEVPLNSLLSVSALGYKTKVIEALPALVEIILSSENNGQLVQIAYRKVDENDLMGDISFVDIPGIMEKNYFRYNLEGMAAYTGGLSSSLWGMDEYLMLVDGVPRSTVDAPEIEQITFLKGINAVALYGSCAAKGVIYITTKRGEVSAKQKINVRANEGMYVPKSYPKYLGSAEYMTLYNEARVNDGLTELYSDEDIYHYASGENPYRYPDVDYYSSDYLKKTYTRYDVTAEISGGDKRARYYTNIGYYSYGDLLNFGEAVNDNTERLNMRGNIDMDLNEYISCKVDASAIFYGVRGVNADYWGNAATLRPNSYTPLIPISMIETDETTMKVVENSNNIIDGKYILGGSQTYQTNPIADIYAGGYYKYYSRQFQFTTGVDVDLRNVLKGLSFHSLFGVDYATSYTTAYNNAYMVFEPKWTDYAGGTGLISGFNTYGSDSISGVQDVSGSYYQQTISFSGHFDYNTVVNDHHHISAMLIANGYQQGQSESYHNTCNANLGIQAGYNYQDKYYADFSGAVVHSTKLPKKNRNAFSPTVSLAWRISEEAFMDGITAIDDLKLSASAGILNTDLDIDDYYLYKGVYANNTWTGWRDGTSVQSYDSQRGENPNLDYPQLKEINVGINASLFKRMLTFNGSFFFNRMTGKIIQSSVLYPSYFSNYYPSSSFIPYSNYEEDQRVGFDFNVKFNKRIGEVDFSLGVAGTYYNTKAVKRAESYENDYQNRQGKPLDGIWGYETLGFYEDDADIASSPESQLGYDIKPGDLKYKDQNGDEVINTEDQVYLGKDGWYGDPFTLGVNLTVKWKNVTFFALGTGYWGAYSIKGSNDDDDYYWIDSDDKYSEVVRGRWTEETKNTATYPRLTTLSSNNNLNSDFWLYKTNRFSLSKIQLSYDIPKRIMQKTFIREMGVYVSGSDLLTISPEHETLELNVGEAPQTRFFNLGVKARF